MKSLKFGLLLTAGVFLPFSGVVFPQPPNLYTFGSDVEITTSPPTSGTSILFESSGQHYTAFRGDTVYVVWWESRGSVPPIGNHVLFAKSTDGGQTFGSNIRVNSTPSGFNPSMKVDTAGIIYVAYERQADIYFTKSTDGGATFIPAVLVVDSAGLSSFQEKPSIAVNNKGQVFVAWIDDRTTSQSVFAAASYDGGLAFTPNIQANEVSTIVSGGIDVAVNDTGCIYVTYRGTTGGGFGIVVARSVDSGQSYGHHVLASDLPPPETGPRFAEDPSIAISPGGFIGVAWQDGRFDQWTLRFSHSTDFGQTFSPSVRVDDDNDLSSTSSPQFPSLFYRNGLFYVAWRELRIPDSSSFYTDHIFFSYSPNGGQSFSINLNVSPCESLGCFNIWPSIAVNETGRAFVAWLDDRYDPTLMERWHVFGAGGSPTFVKGDLNLDSLLTPVDIVMELNAVFLGQPFPAPFEVADVNCDLSLTPTDVVLLLNATFLGNPFPCS